MKKVALIIVFFLSFSAESFSQDTLAMVRKGELWGFINLKGEVVIDVKYPTCKPFNSGYSKVGGIFFVNTKGERISIRTYIKSGLMGVREFSDGLLAVKVSNYWGYMNTSGEVVISAAYDYSTDFNGGYAIVKKGKEYFVIDKKGKEQKIMLGGKSKVTAVREFSEGLAAVEISKKWGFINTKGEVVVEGQYLSSGSFFGGLAWVKHRTRKGNRVGYINQKGEEIVGPIMIRAKNFDPISGLAIVVGLDGKKAYVNTKGEVINFENSREYKNFWGGMCRDSEHAGDAKIGFLNSSGEWIIKPTYDIARDFNHGYASVRKDGKWGLINLKGEWILETEYDDIKRIYIVD